MELPACVNVGAEDCTFAVERGCDYRVSAVILYLDTSALVKFYLDEEGAGRVREGVQDADIAMRMSRFALHGRAGAGKAP